MRHRKSGRKLGRTPSHRKALLRNMARALLSECRITTTLAKAKTLRGVVEPLITLALRNDVHARRQAYAVLGDHALVKRLFDDIGPLYKEGGGGYTRVVKLALPRKGDAAPLALIELIRKPGQPLEAPKPKKARLTPEAAKSDAPAAEAPAPKVEVAKAPAEEADAPEAAAEAAAEADTLLVENIAATADEPVAAPADETPGATKAE